MFHPLESRWIRACGGALPCCNNSEKSSLEIWKNKSKNGKMCDSKKNKHENNSTYFDLNIWIFLLQFTVLLYR
jgi:hypothetical protein